MLRCIGVGDNVCDKYRHLGLMFPGGQALNFAVYSRMLKQESAYIGVFGSDAVAAHVKHTLDTLGVDRSHCRSYEGANGCAEVDLKNGDRVFLGSNKGGVLREHPLCFTPEDLEYLAQFDVIHTSNNSYMDENLLQLAALPGLVSYDFSGTWKEEARARTVCRYADCVFLSCSELGDDDVRRLTERLHEYGCGMAVATTGARGGILFNGRNHYPFAPKPVEAVDTLGAGDSLATGFLLAYAEQSKNGLPEKGTEAYEKAIYRALTAGMELSARTCGVQGAFGYGTKITD